MRKFCGLRALYFDWHEKHPNMTLATMALQELKEAWLFDQMQ